MPCSPFVGHPQSPAARTLGLTPAAPRSASSCTGATCRPSSLTCSSSASASWCDCGCTWRGCFSDIMMALGNGVGLTYEDYLRVATSDLDSERITAARKLMWDVLNPVPFYAMVRAAMAGVAGSRASSVSLYCPWYASRLCAWVCLSVCLCVSRCVCAWMYVCVFEAHLTALC